MNLSDILLDVCERIGLKPDVPAFKAMDDEWVRRPDWDVGDLKCWRTKGANHFFRNGELVDSIPIIPID